MALTKVAWSMIEGGNELAEAIVSLSGQEPQKYPYSFSFPTTDSEISEMEVLAANNSVGPSGATWWARPRAVGRKEGGLDVVYVTGVHGSPEDRDNADANTNQKLGEAIPTLTRLVLNGSSPTFVTRAINDRLDSHREDEHHVPAVTFNRTNGQIITGYGHRNQSLDKDGASVINKTPIRYGQNLATLSASETIEYDEGLGVTNYCQLSYIGRSCFVFQRVDVGDWYWTTGTGGQNYGAPKQLFDSAGEQYYLGLADCDPEFAGYDAGIDGYRPNLHIFAQSHPTVNPDRTLRFAQGTFIVAGTLPGTRDGGGLYIDLPSTGAAISGTGKINDLTPVVKTDFETVYTAAVGKTVRLLDVQYGHVPRALIAEWDNSDYNHGGSIPYGKTWDLKLVQFDTTWTNETNPSNRWSVVTVASGLRGFLGYDATLAGFDEGLVYTSRGVEGFTSGYVHGACFYRGKNHLDVAPVVYYCDRSGTDVNKHRLIEVTLTATYASVSSTRTLIDNSSLILHRPEMVLYGDKRILFYQASQGWSSFNSWVSEQKWLDLTADFPAAAPTVSVNPHDITVADGVDVSIGVEFESLTGAVLTYSWEYNDGGGWLAAAPTTPFFTITADIANTGRLYRATATNATGSTTSAQMTLTVTP